MLAVACLLGFAVQCAGFYLFVAPAFALADTRAQALVEVTSVQPGFVEGTVRVRLRLLELDGTPLGVFRRTSPTPPFSRTVSRASAFGWSWSSAP